MKKYSEFYQEAPKTVQNYADAFCKHCGLTSRYTKEFKGCGKPGKTACCKPAQPMERKQFKSLEMLKKEVNLQEGERIGVTASGGKDSIHALGVMTDLFGADRVVALTHYKTGLVNPIAEENLKRAVQMLGVKLIKVEDSDMQERFRNNLALLIKNPDPALVRVVLCAGCRYGITKELYGKGIQEGIFKYVSAASYLELAPFKEELLERKGNGDIDAGFEALMNQYKEYDYGDNLFYMQRDQKLKYKSNRQDEKGGLKDRYKDVTLIDLDDYLENDPEKVEGIVKERFGWERDERSWHFDCIVEEVKDMFYYGMLGFTETDFKFSAMVRYGLLSVEEERYQLAVVRSQLENSYSKMEEFFLSQGLADSIEDLRRFYRESPYLNKGLRRSA